MAQLVLGDKYHMQIKHYTILPTADLAVIRAWVADPDHHCYLITQGVEGSEIHSLCVHQHFHSTDVVTPTESHLADMMVETTFPE